MSFTSLVFFLFLPIVFALHYAGRNARWQNGVLLAASYVFYGWWDYRFCGLLLVASLLDYWTGWRIAASNDARVRKAFLIVSIAGNLGILGFFKYFNFFADSMAVMLAGVGLDVNTVTLNIILPVGISFYTFQTLSYTIDIYRGDFQPRRSLVEYLAFVSFFPQLVAGPIERARDLLPQFDSVRRFSHDEAVAGCRLMLWGLFKKMVVADNLGQVAEGVFAQPESASPGQLVVGTICFAFQIYGDFSGYSDIAAGVANLFGIRLRRNFDYPYFAQSLTEFWRRWHISLSSWFRDYVYIPLGGSRGGAGRTAGNLIATMAISGLWHGAAWHFVVWGVFHGVLIAMERSMRSGKVALPECSGGNARGHSLSAMARTLITFALVCAGWILFRAETVGDALEIWSRIGAGLVDFEFYLDLARVMAAHSTVTVLILGFVAVEWFGRSEWNPLPWPRFPRAVRWAVYTLGSWSIILFGAQHPAEFIYFQF